MAHVEPRDTNDGGGASATSVPPPPLARPLPTQVLRKRLGAELDCGKASRLLDRGVVPRVSGGASPLLLRRAAAAAAAEAEVDMPDMVLFVSDDAAEEGRVVADEEEFSHEQSEAARLVTDSILQSNRAGPDPPDHRR